MAHLNVLTDLELDEPTLVEGLPGIGLVGKIVADHLVETFDMAHYANVHCEGIPRVAMYAEGDPTLHTPLRLYADAERDLLVLRADVPIHPSAAWTFAECISGFYEEHGVFPVYLSGVPQQADDTVPKLYGFGVGAGIDRLDAAGVPVPSESGLVSGPTGTLLNYAVEHDVDAAGLTVETDPRFPDPGAARVLITDGLEPLTGLDVPVEDLVERSEEIRAAKERLANQLEQTDEESTRVEPIRMYQ